MSLCDVNEYSKQELGIHIFFLDLWELVSLPLGFCRDCSGSL